MIQEERLLQRLKNYSQSDYYPFHMPGHKRCSDIMKEFYNPYEIDITEIEGFDNLHRPEGILKESMDWAASIYGADKTYYLVNGSSCGILAAVCACTTRGGKILMSRNCHKSVYNGVFLNQLQAEYVYPQILEEYGIPGGLQVKDVVNKLKEDLDIEAVMIVSPTYEGIVSDIAKISEAVHRYGIPLIVDEAHGAHFAFGTEFPQSALELGADMVIQSLHKTLPALTQTAVMHLKNGYINEEEVERYLRVYETTSPSYLFLASIENCIYQMHQHGGPLIRELVRHIKGMRERLSCMQRLKVVENDVVGKSGIFDIDISKIVITTKNAQLNGAQLNKILREQYHLEMEMCGPDYVVAITCVADTFSGLKRLEQALLEIDKTLKPKEVKSEDDDLGWCKKVTSRPEVEMTMFDAINAHKEDVTWDKCIGRISGEFVFIYPPGIPIVAPGEMLLPSLVHTILEYQEIELPVQGPKDSEGKRIQVVKK